MTVDWKLFERPEGGFSQGPDLSTRRPLHDKPGDYGDGFFCGLRCAYSFAVRQAELGQRLVKKRSVA